MALSAAPASNANVVGLLSRWLGKFTRRPVTGGTLEHLTTLPLTAQAVLVLVRYGDENLLLGATAQSVNLLMRNRIETASGGAPMIDAIDKLPGQESLQK